jgi:hypothetical protein
VLGALLLAAMGAVVLGVITVARTYYVDNLPPEVRSPEAAEAVITTVLRYLMASLQTLIVASLILAVGALLAGPSAVAVWFRRLVNRGLDALAVLLRRAGTWAMRTGQALAAAAQPLRIGIVLLAVVLLIAANRPGIPAVLWTTAAVLLVLVVLEVFVRAAPRRPGAGTAAPA